MKHISDTPKNRFKELDKLENEEHLDRTYKYPNSPNNPMTAATGNALFNFPFASTGSIATPTGLPVAAPLYDHKDKKPDEYTD